MPIYRLKENSIQQGFQLSRNKVQIFGGGYANGKTAGLCVKALRLCELYPGCNGLLARSTYPKLNDTLRKEFFKWCPPAWIVRKPTKDDNTCILSNGSTVNFRYVAQRGRTSEDGSTTSNLLSATYDFIGIDQVEDPEIVKKDFDDMLGRLRGTTAYRPVPGYEDETMPLSGPRWLMITANPTHNWLYSEIVFPLIAWQQRGVRTEKLIVDPRTETPIVDLFEGSTYTNADNLPDDFIRGLEASYHGQMRERYLMGKWAAFEGLVYPDFDHKIHVISRKLIEEHLRNLRKQHVQVVAIEGYDFGIASPSCYLVGFVDHWGRIFIIDGYYKPDFKIPDQAQRIKETRIKYSADPDYALDFENDIYADPDIFKKKVIAKFKDTSDSIADIYKDEYNLYMRPSGNDIMSGVAKVGAYLNGVQHIPSPFSDEAPAPLIYFCDELDFIATEFSNYFWKQNPQGQRIDEPIDKDDHSLDVIKYMLSKLPHPSEIVVPRSAVLPEWMYWHEVEETKYGSTSRRV